MTVTALPRFRATSPGRSRGLWITALLISSLGALHWIAAAFGIDVLGVVVGLDAAPLRIAYLAVAVAAVYAIVGILRVSRP